MRRLKDAGLVDVVVRGGNGTGRKSNLYHLNLKMRADTEVETHQDIGSVVTIGTTCQEQEDKLIRQEDIVSPKAKDKPKVKPKRVSEGPSAHAGFPENLNVEAWERYEDYRRNSGYKKLTNEGRRLQQKRLATLSISLQSQAVDDSIANGWQGLFPDKYGDKQDETNPRGGGERVDESFSAITARNRRTAGLC